MKRQIQEMVQQEKNIIENEVMSGHSQGPVDNMIENASMKLLKDLSEKAGNVERRVLHYFQCVGCKDCDKTVKNRHLLASNEKEFRDDVKSLHRSLVKQVESSMEQLKLKLKVDERIHGLGAHMDNVLKRNVEEAIQSRKSEDLTKGDQ